VALLNQNQATKRIFAAAKKNDILQLLIYDAIGASPWGDGVDPKAIKAALDAAGDVKKIALRINSPGGNVFDGAAIYSLLAQHPAEVECWVDGVAASAAFTIAMAADKIHCSEAAMMLCHNASGLCVGKASDMRDMAEQLDKVSSTMRDIYSSRSGMSAAEVQALMDAEEFMTASEAVARGFADDVVKRAPEEEEQARALAASFDLSCYRKPPTGARAETKTKRVDGEDLPKSAFAYQGSDDLADWKLPIKFSTEEKTKSHIRNAIARWSSTDMPNAEEKSRARGRIKAAAKAHDIELGEDSLKDQAAADGACACTCAECQAGDCAQCSNQDCQDPNCGHEQPSAQAAGDELLREQLAIAEF
jgi:ATP-dependent Clp endopeptidase proteolytic subunit ClpP